MEPKDRIILALDVSDPRTALQLVEQLEPHVGLFKIGLELIYTSLGVLLSGSEWEKSEKEKWAVQCLFDRLVGKCFWDLKLHDIPNTVQGASRALVRRLKPVMFTAHASGGKDMMRKAVDEKGKALALAVTILSSHTDEDVNHIFGRTAKEKVIAWTQDAFEAGMDGVVCSPQEISVVRRLGLPNTFLVVTPGVRLLREPLDDQKRIMSPKQAMMEGADYLVVGRPIIFPSVQVSSPVSAARLYAHQIKQGLEARP